MEVTENDNIILDQFRGNLNVTDAELTRAVTRLDYYEDASEEEKKSAYPVEENQESQAPMEESMQPPLEQTTTEKQQEQPQAVAEVEENNKASIPLQENQFQQAEENATSMEPVGQDASVNVPPEGNMPIIPPQAPLQPALDSTNSMSTPIAVSEVEASDISRDQGTVAQSQVVPAIPEEQPVIPSLDALETSPLGTE